MKTIFASFTIAFILLLSGCLAHMDATNAANNLNAQANREGSPYRWYVVDLKGDSAMLEKRLIGKVSPSKTSDTKQRAVLSRIEELERTSGRSEKPLLKEVRILEERKGKTVEAWVFDSSGKEITYTVEHVLGTDDQAFLVRGPWGKRS